MRGTLQGAGLIKISRRATLARLFAFAALLIFGAVTLAWWGFFGVADLASDLGTQDSQLQTFSSPSSVKLSRTT
jgi:hypothetical protein